MSVSLYYGSSRPAPLTDVEKRAIERIVAARLSSFPYQDEEGLCLYGTNAPDQFVEGSTKMPLDPDRVLPVILHVLDSVTELRRALPGTQWHVHLDDLDIPWDESDGYVLSGM